MKTLDECLAELNNIEGLENIKKEINEFVNLHKVFAQRKKFGLVVPQITYNLIFGFDNQDKVNKIIEIILNIYYLLGIITEEKIIRKKSDDIICYHIGATATRANDIINESLGGILLVNDFCNFVRTDKIDYGREAVDVFYKALNSFDNFIMIIVDKKKEINEFIKSNPTFAYKFNRSFF